MHSSVYAPMHKCCKCTSLVQVRKCCSLQGVHAIAARLDLTAKHGFNGLCIPIAKPNAAGADISLM